MPVNSTLVPANPTSAEASLNCLRPAGPSFSTSNLPYESATFQASRISPTTPKRTSKLTCGAVYCAARFLTSALTCSSLISIFAIAPGCPFRTAAIASLSQKTAHSKTFLPRALRSPVATRAPLRSLSS
ncbi:hypothetical protein G6F50_017919 [Rhizopus delemar]|uniref:Uncharacterized protein n=1 Tax=Rhizopus delemar TaxID=936053 RepID=A0A9P6XNN1_9FUNG|nr:hypothetical protein G6F50_017919 [Rhizopus delemar]